MSSSEPVISYTMNSSYPRHYQAMKEVSKPSLQDHLDSPSFIDLCFVSLAREVLNVTQTAVDLCPVRLAHRKEVRTQSAYGVLGNVRQ